MRNKNVCGRCGFRIHPNVPCSEVIAVNNRVDSEYVRLLRTVLEKGRKKKNRTGVDTVSTFGDQAKFEVNLSAFPVLTTKRVWFKGIVHELLWFIRGDTNIEYLVDNDVHIWDEWAYKQYKQDYHDPKMSQNEFVHCIKTNPTFAKEYGDLGKGTYGSMWRDFPVDDIDWRGNHTLGVDQLASVMECLVRDPDSRRMIVSVWHPHWSSKCALAPCHCLFHFNTEELTFEERCDIMRSRYPGVSSWDGMGGIGSLEVVAKEPGWLDRGGMGTVSNPVPKRRLNLLLYQRSCDLFLGVPFNITSYSLLLAMVAHCVNMVPGVFTHTYGDLHIYENHMKQVNLQLGRDPRKLPSLWLNPKVNNLFDFKAEDIILNGYDPHPKIDAPIAV